MIKIFIPGNFDKEEAKQYKKGFKRSNYYKIRKAQGKIIKFVNSPRRGEG